LRGNLYVLVRAGYHGNRRADPLHERTLVGAGKAVFPRHCQGLDEQLRPERLRRMDADEGRPVRGSGDESAGDLFYRVFYRHGGYGGARPGGGVDNGLDYIRCDERARPVVHGDYAKTSGVGEPVCDGVLPLGPSGHYPEYLFKAVRRDDLFGAAVDILRGHDQDDRIYRAACLEGRERVGENGPSEQCKVVLLEPAHPIAEPRRGYDGKGLFYLFSHFFRGGAGWR